MQNQKKENQMGNSRVLKFRAWDKERKEFLDYFEVGCRGMIICNEKNEPQNIELMQFTGLKDKNGVEIYEGDIVSSNGESAYQVIWEDNWQLGFRLQPIEDLEKEIVYTFDETMDKNIEIIGNIYENPELLTNN